MQTTENLGLRKPEAGEFYSVEDVNYNTDVIDEEISKIKETSDPKALEEHTKNKENPHGVTKKQVGLGDVPNVATNDQTPTYTVPNTESELTSGEKLGIALGKVAKAVKSLISHLADTTIHVTASEKSAWNSKANASHGNHVPDTETASNKKFLRNDNTWQEVTPANIGAAPSSHNQGASTITAGTFGGKVQANASAMATFTNAQVRDIVIKASVTEGGSASESNGTIVFTKG